MISDADADATLTQALGEARTPHGTVDNVLRVHSLRPATLRGHMALYRSVLHDPEISLPFRLLEIAGTYVSILNGCDYSVTHHSSNLRRLVGDDERTQQIMYALTNRTPQDAFDGLELALLQYAEKLTLDVGRMDKSDYDKLIEAGCEDAQVLEINQVVGYFCYVNRLLNGLGVTTDGDVIGFY